MKALKARPHRPRCMLRWAKSSTCRCGVEVSRCKCGAIAMWAPYYARDAGDPMKMCRCAMPKRLWFVKPVTKFHCTASREAQQRAARKS